jgi:hypothetical protein
LATRGEVRRQRGKSGDWSSGDYIKPDRGDEVLEDGDQKWRIGDHRKSVHPERHGALQGDGKKRGRGDAIETQGDKVGHGDKQKETRAPAGTDKSLPTAHICGARDLRGDVRGPPLVAGRP